MTAAAVILILISAGLHAGWNLVSKSGKPSPFFFLILTLSSMAILSPFWAANVGALKVLPLRFWMLLGITGLFQTVYYTGLAKAYSHGDISLVYPLVRAIPVLLVPAITAAFSLGAPLSGQAAGGMALIGVGCILVPVRSFRTWHIRDYSGKALLWVIPGAIGTTGYTIIDSIAMKIPDPHELSVPVSLVYSGLINLSIIPWMIVSVTLLSGWGERRHYRGRQVIRPLAAGVAVSLAYMFVLAAMNYVSNVSYVAGFRQLSIPLGVILGGVFLKEKMFLPRIIGCLLIVAGLVITALY